VKTEDDLTSAFMLKKPQATQQNQIFQLSYPARKPRLRESLSKKKSWWDNSPDPLVIRNLSCDLRYERKFKDLKRLRKSQPERWVPSVICGGGKDRVFIKLDSRLLTREIRRGKGFASIPYNLNYGGISELVYPTAMQLKAPSTLYSIVFTRTTMEQVELNRELSLLEKEKSMRQGRRGKTIKIIKYQEKSPETNEAATD